MLICPKKKKKKKKNPKEQICINHKLTSDMSTHILYTRSPESL
jgi:hypothetical protein